MPRYTLRFHHSITKPTSITKNGDQPKYIPTALQDSHQNQDDQPLPKLQNPIDRAGVNLARGVLSPTSHDDIPHHGRVFCDASSVVAHYTDESPFYTPVRSCTLQTSRVRTAPKR
mmetsp:Transcript_2824/g.3722  ORF Transcript_2824/g.3722 Transcript_2824/m.3722 type:complete len:115 (-) Transcript_2824:404-748(-)